MRGKVNYITENIYNNNGIFDTVVGADFENKMYEFICKSLKNKMLNGLRINQTPVANDGGKDIIIYSPIDFELFGIKFCLKGKPQITVHIECKSSKKNKIPTDKISHNILMANEDDIDYFVLLTNKCISPEAYYEASQNAQKNGYEFYLIDKILLLLCFEQDKYTIPDISVSYQIEYGKMNGRNSLDIFMLFQNNSTKPQLCGYQLKSDRNWNLEFSENKFYLDAHCAVVKKVTATKEYYDGIDDLILNFEFINNKKNVIISGSNFNYEFETPLVGEQHKNYIEDIYNKIMLNSNTLFLHLYGEAGIGKTRIKDEIYKKIVNTDNEIIEYKCCENPEKDDLERFINTLAYKKVLTDKESEINELYKRFVIFLDDFHYASKKFIEYITKIITKEFKFNVPITIFIIGRNDDTIYNTHYSSFLNYTKIEKNIYAFPLDKLKDTDCFSLIQSIINEVPEVVKEKIYTASQNNPFYIIQFIEYLLECKLVNIFNRNTVGVINAATFINNIYIPSNIEELLYKRLNILYNEISKTAYNFLLILAFMNNTCIQNNFDIYFSENDEAKEYLLQHHIIKQEPTTGNIIFEHENLYLFCKKLLTVEATIEKVCKIILSCDYLFNSLSELKKGKVYFSVGNYEKALIYYKSIVNSILKFNDIAANNIPFFYLEYLDDVYILMKYKENISAQKNCLLAEIYISLHNITNGLATQVIEKVEKKITSEHKTDTILEITFKQMKMHYYMQCGNNLKAMQIANEMLALERFYGKEIFSPDTCFNLFDRTSSLYNQLNHKTLAIQYNNLGFAVAEDSGNENFLALSYMSKSKILFFTETKKALENMLMAQEIFRKNDNKRLMCHNMLSIISAKILINYKDNKNFVQQINEQLKIARSISYPIAEIRAYFLLAIEYYLHQKSSEDIEIAKRYLEQAIELSILNASIKILPNIYNLKAIISSYENQNTNEIYKYYNTMIQYLKQQNQLFIGTGDFTYSNIINLTNYSIFLDINQSENEFYKFMAQIGQYDTINYCNYGCKDSPLCFYTCNNSIEQFQKIYNKIKDGYFINLDKSDIYILKDLNTKYYLPLIV